MEQISKALPEADIRCLWNDAPERFGSDVAESWLARTPLRKSKAAALPFLSHAARAVDLRDYSRVVVSSHAFGHHLAAKAVRQGLDAYAYVHSPARYIWTPDLDERGDGYTARLVARQMRKLDRRYVHEDVHYAANSEFVRQRIRMTWEQESTVIYPPVAVEQIQSERWRTALSAAEMATLARLPDAFVLGASRLIEYKRLDLTMQAGEALDLPVVIAGAGPYEEALRTFAASRTVPVEFLGRVSTPLLYALYERATLFAFFAIEDFGIMPVEAMAAGTPVLVNAVGGAAESAAAIGGGVALQVTGGTAEFAAAALRASALDRDVMRAAADYFSEANFRGRIEDWVSGRLSATD